MSETLRTPDQNNLDIKNLRKRVQEIADSKEGTETYSERLKSAFAEVSLAISQTVGKVEGGDISNAEGISEESLAELQARLEELKSLLP